MVPYEPPDAAPHVRWCGLSITHKYGIGLKFGLVLKNSDIDLEQLFVQFSHPGIIGQHFSSLRQLAAGQVYRSRLL